MKKFIMATLLGLLIASASLASAATMTFDGLSGQYYGSYTENGMTATPPAGGIVWAWPVSGVAHLDPGYGGGNRFLEFTYSGGNFDLLSVEILTIGGAGGYNGMWQAYSNGNLVGSLFTDSLSNHVVNFGSDFSNVDLVRVSNLNYHFSFDDLTFDEATAPTVPEPSTVALLGLGLAGAAFLRRRAKQ